MPPEVSQYGIAPTIGLWLLSIIWLWLKLRNQEVSNTTNGHKIDNHEIVISQLATKIVKMESDHKLTIEKLEREKAMWQLRAYECEEREGQKSK
jgi:hypothetical protein